MMNATEAQQAVSSFPYPMTGTPREERKVMRNAWKANQFRVENEFADYLADEYLSFGYSEQEQAQIFGEAWAYGHDAGYHAVEAQYHDLEELEARASQR